MLGAENAIGSAAIMRGLLIKASTEPGWYATIELDDPPALIVGASASRCPGAGSRFRAHFRPGNTATLRSDGTTEILTGDPVEPSDTVAGRVKKCAESSSKIVAFNVGQDVAADLDAELTVRLGLQPAGASSGPTITVTPIKTADYTAAAGEFVPCDPSDGGFTVTLPSPVGVAGEAVWVRNRSASTNPITIAGLFDDGSPTVVIDTPWAGLKLVSDGATWGAW